MMDTSWQLLQPDRERQDAKTVDCFVCRVKGGRTRDVLAPVGLVVTFASVITLVLIILRRSADSDFAQVDVNIAGWTSSAGNTTGAYFSASAGPSKYCEQWHEQKYGDVITPKSHLVESPIVVDREANTYFVTAALVPGSPSQPSNPATLTPLLSVQLSKVFSNNAEQYSVNLWNTSSYLPAALSGAGGQSTPEGTQQQASDLGAGEDILPILFAQLAIDHLSGVIGVTVTGSFNSSAIGPEARVPGMPEVVQVSIFAAVNAQHGDVLYLEDNAPAPMQSDPVLAPTLKRAYALQVSPATLRNSSGLHSTDVSGTQRAPMTRTPHLSRSAAGLQLDSDSRHRALQVRSAEDWAIFYVLQKFGAEVELVTYRIAAGSSKERPGIVTMSFGDSTAAPWGYGEQALVSLVVDEPSGVLVVAFPADSVNQPVLHAQESANGWSLPAVQVYGVDLLADPYDPRPKWELSKQQKGLGPGGGLANITDIRSNWLLGGGIAYAAASLDGYTGVLSVDTGNGDLIGFLQSSGLEPRRATIGQPAPIVQVALSAPLLWFCQAYLPSLYDWDAAIGLGTSFRPGSGVGIGAINLDAGTTTWNDIDGVEACASPVVVTSNIGYVVAVQPNPDASRSVPRSSVEQPTLESTTSIESPGRNESESSSPYQYVLKALHPPATSYFERVLGDVVYPPAPLRAPFFVDQAGRTGSLDTDVYGSSGRYSLALASGGRLISKHNSAVDQGSSQGQQPSVVADASVSALLTMVKCAGRKTIQDTGWSVLFFGTIGALALVRVFGSLWFCCFVAKRDVFEMQSSYGTGGGYQDDLGGAASAGGYQDHGKVGDAAWFLGSRRSQLAHPVDSDEEGEEKATSTSSQQVAVSGSSVEHQQAAHLQRKDLLQLVFPAHDTSALANSAGAANAQAASNLSPGVGPARPPPAHVGSSSSSSPSDNKVRLREAFQFSGCRTLYISDIPWYHGEVSCCGARGRCVPRLVRQWCGMQRDPAARESGPTPAAFPHSGAECSCCPKMCGFGPRHVTGIDDLVSQSRDLVPDDALPGTSSSDSMPVVRHAPWSEACSCGCGWLRCRDVHVLHYKYINKESNTSGFAAVPTRRLVRLPSGVGCGPYQAVCEMTRRPWAPCHLIMYVVIIVMVAVVFWAASDAQRSIRTVAEKVGVSPGEFFLEYLVDRQSSPDAECPSTAGAACFCLPGTQDATRGVPRCQVSSGGSDLDSEQAFVWGVSTVQGQCSYYDKCARPCDGVLQDTGNCAAQVFTYSCTCGEQCNDVAVTNTSVSGVREPGLGQALEQCRIHFDYIRVILNGGTGLYVVFVAAFVWYQQIECCASGGTYSPLDLGLVKAQDVEDSVFDQKVRIAQQQMYGQAFEIGSEGVVSSQGASQAMNGSQASIARSLGGSAARHTDSSHLSYQESAVKPRGQPRRGKQGSAVAKPGANKLQQLDGVSCLWNEGGLLFVVFIVLSILAIVIIIFEYVLVADGRSCTGADWEVDPRKDSYVTRGQYDPSKSFILSNIQACSFDGKWRTEDYEGKALTSCWLAISAQVVAYGLFAIDLLLYWLQALVFRSNVSFLGLSIQEHRIRQRHITESDIMDLNNTAVQLLPGYCKTQLLAQLQLHYDRPGQINPNLFDLQSDQRYPLARAKAKLSQRSGAVEYSCAGCCMPSKGPARAYVCALCCRTFVFCGPSTQDQWDDEGWTIIEK